MVSRQSEGPASRRGPHTHRLPGWARALAEQQQADAERVEIRAELVAAGLL
jgi:hypothetical protein